MHINFLIYIIIYNILQHLIKKFNLKNVGYVNSIAQTYDLVLATLAGSNVNGRLRHRDFYFRLDPNLDVYKDKAREQLLGLKELPKNLDSTDGLAAAVCHFFNSGKVIGDKSYTGWDAFVKNNENRIKK